MVLQQNLLKTEPLNKTISIISLNYYPEDTAIGLYSTQMAEHLQSNGWNVTVITGFPYYPQWEIFSDYKNKKSFLEENIKGIRVLRYKQFVPSNPSFTKRIFHIIDFTFGSYFNIKKVKKADVVLSIIPFTSSSWLGYKLSKKLNAKHWIHVQDFEFDVALESGITSNSSLNKFFSNILSKLESKILNSANIVSAISYGMLDKLSKKSKSRSYYFPNWIDNIFINPIRANKHPFLLSEKFKILYAGNIGEKQDWSLFLQIAEHFNAHNNIEFIIVGNGSFKNKLIEQTKKLKNVNFHEPVPYNELNDLLCSADLHILFQKDAVIDTVMPSKILGMFASKIPSIITGNTNSEVANTMKSTNIGYFYKPLDRQPLIKKIEELISKNNISEEIGENARNYVVNSFSRKVVIRLFNQKINQLNEN